jgi:O-antigen ligase
LSLSKTGLLSLLIAIAATAVMYRVVKGWRNGRPAIAVALITFVSVTGILLIVDATDGEHDIAHGLRKRGGQVLIEADQAIGLATGGKVQADGRAAIWRRYTQDFLDSPITGTGLGTPTVGYPYAHNAPLEAAGGSGVLGVAGWFLLWGSVGLALKRLVLEHPEALALVGAVGVVFVASLFLSTNYEPIVALVFGIVLAPHSPRPVVQGSQ